MYEGHLEFLYRTKESPSLKKNMVHGPRHRGCMHTVTWYISGEILSNPSIILPILTSCMHAAYGYCTILGWFNFRTIYVIFTKRLFPAVQ